MNMTGFPVNSKVSICICMSTGQNAARCVYRDPKPWILQWVTRVFCTVQFLGSVECEKKLETWTV